VDARRYLGPRRRRLRDGDGHDGLEIVVEADLELVTAGALERDVERPGVSGLEPLAPFLALLLAGIVS
jgi:hypothetical protein